MKSNNKPSAAKEIEKGAISVGGQVTLTPFATKSNRYQVKHRGTYVGVLTSQGDVRLKVSDPDTYAHIHSRVERWYSEHGTCNQLVQQVS